MFQTIRDFMAERQILEVDTPILGHFAITDPYIETIRATAKCDNEPLYLHTSPELCMKRLLAAGSGSIYQITHAFRDEARGRYHATEFSMLEWYRPDMDHHALMDELAELLRCLEFPAPVKQTYAVAFHKAYALDPHTISTGDMTSLAGQQGLLGQDLNRHELLDFLFSHAVTHHLDNSLPLLIYDYPAELAALARIRRDAGPVAERFELFIHGVEIANGFHELIDAEEQHARFKRDLAVRQARHVSGVPIDTCFLAALESGLPNCAGIAIGLDRLLLMMTQHERLSQVTAFSLENN